MGRSKIPNEKLKRLYSGRDEGSQQCWLQPVIPTHLVGGPAVNACVVAGVSCKHAKTSVGCSRQRGPGSAVGELAAAGPWTLTTMAAGFCHVPTSGEASVGVQARIVQVNSCRE